MNIDNKAGEVSLLNLHTMVKNITRVLRLSEKSTQRIITGLMRTFFQDLVNSSCEGLDSYSEISNNEDTHKLIAANYLKNCSGAVLGFDLEEIGVDVDHSVRLYPEKFYLQEFHAQLMYVIGEYLEKDEQLQIEEEGCGGATSKDDNGMSFAFKLACGCLSELQYITKVHLDSKKGK